MDETREKFLAIDALNSAFNEIDMKYLLSPNFVFNFILSNIKYLILTWNVSYGTVLFSILF